MSIIVKVQKLVSEAKLPVRATTGAACYDICAIGVPEEGIKLLPRDTVILSTGLSFEIPNGYKMNAYSRSGQGFNYDVRLANGTGIIDSDYRGELKVKLTRDNVVTEDPIKDYVIRNGDRICQVEIAPVLDYSFVESDELSSTDRGTGGFGSTGTR